MRRTLRLTAFTTATLACTILMAQEQGGRKMGDYLFPVGGGKWQNASAETPAEGDRPSEITWEFAKAKHISCADIVHDWTSYTGIAFTIATNKASNSMLYLIIPSEDKTKDGSDYYSLRFKLDFEGAKDLMIPFDELGKARFPIGLHQINSFSFNNAWNPKDFVDPDVVVKIRNLRLVEETNLPKTGPRIADKELFQELLDLDYPGLAKVKAAVEKGDLKAARHELAEHIRHREKPLWFVAPKDRPTRDMPPQTRRAEKGVGGRYRATAPVDWTGWKKVTLTKDGFKPQGKPLGWDWISKFSLSAQVTGDPTGVTLYLDDVKLVGPAGECSLGDFESEATGWRDVFRSEEQAHSGKASGKWWFLDMFRTTFCEKFPGDWTKYDALEFWLHVEKPAKLDIIVSADSYPPDTEYADTILTHKFTIGGFKKNVFDFGQRINWSSNAMTEGESSTIEWNAQLNRHFHFQHLVRAYWETGDEKYARELAQEMNAWIEDCPLLLISSGNSPYHYAWETLNTACRFQMSWPDAIFSCILSPEFTDDIIVNIVKSAAEHAKHLIKNPTSGNWYTAEALGIFTVGVLFPEYKTAKEWRSIGIDRLYRQLNDEIYPDGMEYEVALGYNCWVLREYVRIIEIATLNGLMGEVPADYKDRIEKMYNYLMYDCMPDGNAVGLNDSGNANMTKTLVEGYRYFPHRPDFIYAVTNGKCGKRPPQDSVAMPYSGHYIMRSGWDREARMLHMDAGLLGHGHMHEDKLHVAMYAYGKQLLPDAGNFMYDRSRWRKYVLITRSHNTVLVDGMDQYRSWNRDLRTWPKPWDAPAPATDTRWVSVFGLDYCEGFYKDKYREYSDWQNSAQKPTELETVQHARSVLFVKPNFWIVQDTLTATDDAEHTCDVLYHINADEATVAPQTNAITSASKDSSDVTIAPLNVEGLKAAVVKGKIEPPIQGWTNCGWKPRDPEYPMLAIPTAIFSKAWKKQTHIVTVIYPFPADGNSPVKSVSAVEAAEGIVAAQIELDGGAKCTYLWNPKPGETVKANGLSADGEAAVACPQPGAAFRLLLVNGKTLALGEASMAINKQGSVSITGYYESTYVMGCDAPCECAVRIPGLMEKGAIEVHKIDNNLVRLGKIEAKAAGVVVTFQAEAGAAYEISLAGAKDLKTLLEDEAAKGGAKALGLDFPINSLPTLPPSKGIMVVVQAEDLAGQGGGEVTVTDKKVGISGKAFLKWDKPGHFLEYKFSVPADGEYWVTLKYCTENMRPVRAMVLDGAFPAEWMREIAFESTGGWSNERDDWKLWTVTDPKTKRPFPFCLRKGEHVLRLVNVQESMNLDVILIHSSDVGAE
ncbi:MAG: heparinase II/III family protein [Planctomycetota bacterium]